MVCKKCGAEIFDENDRFCQICGEPLVKASGAGASDVDFTLDPVWPEWQIEGLIGKGSYGAVYKAVRRDHNVESRSAVKHIRVPSDPAELESLRAEGLGEDGTRTYLQGIVNDFVGEIQLMQTLKGIQNIVSVEDYKVIEDIQKPEWNIYIRMELLTPFTSYIKDREISEDEVIKLGCDICNALEICSKQGILHRDVKPENIFLNKFGDFKLGDFGTARRLENVTGGMSQKGTFNYMAPEVMNSTRYDHRVDIYSLGVVLYRMMNENRLPFIMNEEQHRDPAARKQALDRRLRGEVLPAPCKASPQFAKIILRACAYHPDWRYSSASEMKYALEDLRRAAKHAPVPAPQAAEEYDKTVSIKKVDPAAAPAEDNTSPTSSSAADAPKPPKEKSERTKSNKPIFVVIAVVVALSMIAAAVLILYSNGVFDDLFGNTAHENKDDRKDEVSAAGNEPKTTEAAPVTEAPALDDTASREYSYGSLSFVTPEGWSVIDYGGGSFGIFHNDNGFIRIKIYKDDDPALSIYNDYVRWENVMKAEGVKPITDFINDKNFYINYFSDGFGYYIEEFIPSYDSGSIVSIYCKYSTDEESEAINEFLNTISR